MIDRDGKRITSQTWRGDDFTARENPDIITEVPTTEELKNKDK